MQSDAAQPRVRALFLDAGGVLQLPTPGPILQLLARHGLTASEEHLRRALFNDPTRPMKEAIPTAGMSTVGLLTSPNGLGPYQAALALYPGRIKGLRDLVYNFPAWPIAWRYLSLIERRE